MNRYEILKLLGRGGMGSVYLARDTLLGREVALKILKGACSEEGLFRERFKNETKSAASLSHPHVVSVFDAGETPEGTCYMAMEVVSGGTLEERVERKGPLAPDEAARIATEVAHALSYAHGKGLVHRDIKPQNVLLTEEGTVKVADFGIAKAADSTTVTATDLILGTVRYISPEQATGEDVGPASDLYSLGVTLYEMLTGEVPFDAENPIAIAMKHVREIPSPPRQANPEIPPALEAITLKLLSKDPGQRYATADELCEDLERYRDGQRPAALGDLPAPSAAGMGQVHPDDRNAETLWLARAEKANSRRVRRRRRNLGVAATLVAAMLGIALLPASSGGFATGTAERLEDLRSTVGDAQEGAAVATIDAPPVAAVPEAPGLPEPAGSWGNSSRVSAGANDASTGNTAASRHPTPATAPAASAAAPAAGATETEAAAPAAVVPVVVAAPDPDEAAQYSQPSSREDAATRDSSSAAPEPETKPEESEGTPDAERPVPEKPEKPDVDVVNERSSVQQVGPTPKEPADPTGTTPQEATPGAGSAAISQQARQTAPVSASEIRDATKAAVKKQLTGTSDP